jgi:hypothetical protein
MTIPQKLYFHPIKGEIIDQYPNTVIVGHISGNYSGSISLELPSGESCRGKWAIISQTQAETELSSEWDLVYGQGYFMKNIQGERNRAEAKLVGNKGSILVAELHKNSEHEANCQGVAKDSTGNVYKITN